MKSGDVNMEIPQRHPMLSDRKKAIGGTKGNSSETIHLEPASDDDSGTDEPQPISLKKAAIVPLKTVKELNNNNGHVRSRRDSGTPVLALCNNNRDNGEDHHRHDGYESSGPSGKEGGVSTSFTSGENSDAEMGGEGEELGGMNMKQEDSRKCFECDVCNMTFSNGANMRRHRMRHTGVKPYECRVCQKRFFRKDHLAEHMATHSKLLPFRCPICNKGFQRQIAMRAHFQNEHVGGSHDMVKACPLCSYKAGSMKSLRVHFRTRHGIDLDNPVPHSSGSGGGNGSLSNGGSPGPSNGEYSELAHALGFEDREKDSLIPSHFLVPQIEISSNSPYPAHYSFSSDSSYNFAQDETNGGGSERDSPANVSPQSDSSSRIPSSSELNPVVVKKEIMDEQVGEKALYKEDPKTQECSDNSDEVQDMPEDLSAGNSNGSSSGSSPNSKCCPSLSKVSPLKSLLRDEWKKEANSQSGQNGFSCSVNINGSSSSSGSGRSLSDSSSHSGSNGYHTQYESEAITSSNGGENGTTQTAYARRRVISSAPIHQCVFCGIIFPDKTLYFLHKGCHSESNPWRCNICGESCTNVYDFNSHLLSKSHQ